jgi:hypothetical protein
MESLILLRIIVFREEAQIPGQLHQENEVKICGGFIITVEQPKTVFDEPEKGWVGFLLMNDIVKHFIDKDDDGAFCDVKG